MFQNFCIFVIFRVINIRKSKVISDRRQKLLKGKIQVNPKQARAKKLKILIQNNRKTMNLCQI